MAVLPGSGSFKPFNKHTAIKDKYVTEFKKEIERLGVELYLYMLVSTIPNNYPYFFTLENLYYDEYDLKTINLKKILYGHIDLKVERN